jgi:transposase-like protein
VGSWLSDFWEGFLSVPEAMCPKCRNGQVEYYDPYFFGLWRTLSGRRRFKCRDCGFVWRRSRGETYLDRMGF